MPSSAKASLALYLLGFAALATVLVAAVDYFQIQSNAGLSIAQLFLEGGFCMMALTLLGDRKAVLKSDPKSGQRIIMRYVFLIGFPAVIAPVIVLVLLLVLGAGHLLQLQISALALSVLAGLVYFAMMVLAGLCLPGALQQPADSLRTGFARSRRQIGATLPRLLFFMAPFAVAAFALSVLLVVTGVIGSAPAGDLYRAAGELGGIFVVKLLSGLSILGFCATVLAAHDKDLEEGHPA